MCEPVGDIVSRALRALQDCDNGQFLMRFHSNGQRPHPNSSDDHFSIPGTTTDTRHRSWQCRICLVEAERRECISTSVDDNQKPEEITNDARDRKHDFITMVTNLQQTNVEHNKSHVDICNQVVTDPFSFNYEDVSRRIQTAADDWTSLASDIDE